MVDVVYALKLTGLLLLNAILVVALGYRALKKLGLVGKRAAARREAWRGIASVSCRAFSKQLRSQRQITPTRYGRCA